MHKAKILSNNKRQETHRYAYTRKTKRHWREKNCTTKHRSEAMHKNCEFCMPGKTSKNFLTLQLIQFKISSSDINKNIFSICKLAISCSFADAREVTVASAWQWQRASQACQRRPQQREGSLATIQWCRVLKLAIYRYTWLHCMHIILFRLKRKKKTKKKVRRICEEPCLSVFLFQAGAALIVDEVQTGVGVTGRMW